MIRESFPAGRARPELTVRNIMAKTLCDMEKKLKKSFDSYARLVDDPNYICTKCGRAANKKKNLCRPREIDSAPS